VFICSIVVWLQLAHAFGVINDEIAHAMKSTDFHSRIVLVVGVVDGTPADDRGWTAMS